MSTYGTLSYGNGFIIGTDSTKPVETPSGILVTRSVETKAGWVGQIVVDRVIVWESPVYNKDDHDVDRPEKDAVRAANVRVIKALTVLFADE